jgi:hypothetical protein
MKEESKMKFNVGDNVQRIGCSGGNMRIGETAKVIAEFTKEGEQKIVLEYIHNGKELVGIYSSQYYRKLDNIDSAIQELAKEVCEMNITVGIITKEPENKPFKLERYIINDNATILFWSDGDKTIVKKAKGDKFDKRLGFLYGYFQKMSGMTRNKANKFIESLELEKDVK